jgi:hypothetical protein
MDIFIVYALVLVALSVSAMGLIKYAEDGYEGYRVLAGVVGMACFFLVFLVGILIISMAFNWIAAGQKVNILSREYGTHYTQSEIFYAADVIETVKEINRKRTDLSIKIKQD